MTLAEKTAQSLNEMHLVELELDEPMDTNDADELVLLEFEEPGQEDIVFILPDVPGADDQSEIVLDEDKADADSMVVMEPEDEVEVEEKDPWDWHSDGLSKFLHWLKERIEGVPRHSGRDVSGLERALAYFEALEKEITKAMRQDYKGEIDVAKAEEARDEIEYGIERLVERLEKVKSSKYKRHAKKTKKAEADEMLVKEGQKHTHVGGIVVTVPLFISTLARTLINGAVSAGHDIEDMFDKLSEKYKLTDREQLELVQLLKDMGYAVRRDRGYKIDEKYDETSSDNFDFASNFPG